MDAWVIGWVIIILMSGYIYGFNKFWSVWVDTEHFETSTLIDLLLVPLIPIFALCSFGVIFWLIPLAIGSIFI